MGRHASFEPFRKKINGIEYGNYICYSPIVKSNVDLGTTEYSDAVTEANKLSNKPNSNATFSVPSVEKQTVTNSQPQNVLSVDSPIDPLDALNNYLSQTNANNQPEVASPATQQSPIQGEQPSIGVSTRPDLGRVQPSNLPVTRKAKGLSPEQAAKVSEALSKGAAKLNLAIDEIVISVAGFKIKDDLELDETDLAFLKLGWEMQLEQWFQKSNPEPWHLILIGNAFIIMTLLKNSERKPKRDKRSEQQTSD